MVFPFSNCVLNNQFFNDFYENKEGTISRYKSLKLVRK